jgi:hypothetical protein
MNLPWVKILTSVNDVRMQSDHRKIFFSSADDTVRAKFMHVAHGSSREHFQRSAEVMSFNVDTHRDLKNATSKTGAPLSDTFHFLPSPSIELSSLSRSALESSCKASESRLWTIQRSVPLGWQCGGHNDWWIRRLDRIWLHCDTVNTTKF